MAADPNTDRQLARQRQALLIVATSSQNLDEAVRTRNAVIVGAYRDTGASLRDIADAAQLSHAQVKRIVDNAGRAR